MSAPDDVYKLVEKFDRDKPGSEHELRIQFVDPLFKALGWDPRDKDQVRHEPRIIIKEEGLERSKKPDYSFHIGNARHFFVETKMPHINLEGNPIPAYQLRRYGWTGQTLVSVLTDFEEFSIYDCRIKPQRSDPAKKARLRYYQYGDYIDKWDEFEARFSREAVAEGALREWIEGERVRGILSFDQSFLRDMEEWRELLAKDIALHNRDLSQRQLNLLVQRTIDRIVFLRIAEDRDIEAYGRLRSAADEGKQVYEGLKILFNEADDKYNSGLFHFGKEKRASEPDDLSLKIHIPDEPLRHIIKNLYFPFSPYEFSVLPADILGQVYEQFLGKVIDLKPGGAVSVEEKPEVRKAGGVYYTPAYIVDYIVENTVGDLLWGKTPAEAAKLRILDPACGSGSFLTGAYQYLLDWHLEYYSRDADNNKNVLRRVVGGYVLTTAEKRRILKNNIYGVDLDQNAVEVSKLSLLLKMLENESDATGRQTIMFSAGGRILPDLSDNIKWGNSLIGSDFFRGPQAGLFDNEEEMNRVKAFDWDKKGGFPAIMDAGGFDAVIGNPPYVRQETLGKEFKDYAKRKYETYAGTADLYTYFIERGVKLLNENGLFGIIVANKWMRARYGKPLREWLKTQAIQEIVDFGDLPVFEQATTYPCILTIGKGSLRDTFTAAQVDSLEFTNLVEHVKTLRYAVDKTLLDDGGWSLARQEVQLLVSRLMTNMPSLDTYVQKEIYRGVTTGLNKAFVIDGDIRASLIEESPNSAELIKHFVAGRDVKRYGALIPSKYLIFARRGVDIESYPAIHSYLNQFKRSLEPKPDDWQGDSWPGRKPGHYKWFEIQDTVDYWQRFETPKIILPDISLQGNFTYDPDNIYCANTAYIIPVDDKYLLGLLNSKLMTFVYQSISSTYRGGYLRFIYQYLAQLPIRTIDFTNPGDVQMHNEMVKLVDEMLERHRQLPNSTGEGRRITKALIATVDGEIDELVYRLYGLSDDEIAIVEGG